MRYVAFKRYKNTENSSMRAHHDDFIVEHAYTDLFPKGFHKKSDGYEIVTEEEFESEIAKNPQLLEEHIEKEQERVQAQREAFKAKRLKEIEEFKKEQKEYQEFLKWKKIQGKR